VAATISITETLSSPLMRSYEFALDLLAELHNMVERFINLDPPIAFKAAEIRAIQKMTLGDAIISATADAVNAELWTCDRELAKKSKNARLLL
jgi:predicted nucleic acid-binding protein